MVAVQSYKTDTYYMYFDVGHINLRLSIGCSHRRPRYVYIKRSGSFKPQSVILLTTERTVRQKLRNMTETAPVVAKSPKKKAAAKPKKPAEHPKYIDMVLDAIKNLKERKGSSRQAILKYVMSKFKVGNDATKVNSRIKVALKNGVKSKALKQSKGVGAQGRFSVGEKKVAAKKPKAVKPKAAAKKPKAKKPKAAKKPAGEKTKKAVKKSPKKATKPKATKPKAAKKSPKKPKAAKPKKVKTPKKAAAKPKKKTPKKAAKK